MRKLMTLIVLSAVAGTAYAQTQPAQPQAPAPIVQGSSTVNSGGLPADRAGDATGDGGSVQEGSPNVSIGGRPAARVGDRANCGVIVRGSSNVYVNGKPLARTGDGTSGC